MICFVPGRTLAAGVVLAGLLLGVGFGRAVFRLVHGPERGQRVQAALAALLYLPALWADVSLGAYLS